MKYLFVSIVIFTLIIFARVNSYAIETGPCIDDGMGNAVCPGVKKKSSSKTYEDIMNSLFRIGNTTDRITTPSPGNNAGPYPTQITPTIPGTTGTPNPTPSVTLPPDQTLASLKELYTYVGNKVGVPPCVLEAVSWIEYPSVDKYSPGQVIQYQQPGQVIPNCPWNSCSAKGHMQMTIGVDERGSTVCNRCGGLSYCPNAWSSHKNAVNQYDGATHNPEVCNLRDSSFAAARKLKMDSGAKGSTWTLDQILLAGKRYYGSGTLRYERLGNRTYGEYLAYRCNL